MTRDYAKYFLNEAKYLSWDTFQECSIFPTDSYEECAEKIRKVIHYYPSEKYIAWDYFKNIYHEIPVQHRMPLMLDVLYTSYTVDYPDMLQYISSYLSIEETAELKSQRIAHNRAVLKNRVRKDGTVKLYRGTAEHFLTSDYAVSYTLDKKVADFFVKYHKAKHKSRFGVVDEYIFDIEDILYYSNGRKEREVFVIPFCIRINERVMSWDDMERLNEDTLFDYFSYDTYEKVMKELGKEL